MTIAIFDLDNTILEGDIEWLWGEYLIQKKVAGPEFLQNMMYYFQLYQSGTLEIRDYQRFFHRPLTRLDSTTLQRMLADFFKTVEKLWRPAMLERIQWHIDQGHTPVLVSASSSFLVEPVSKKLGFPYTICSQSEMLDGVPTGEITGIPAYQEGKVQNLLIWQLDHDVSLDGSWAYSDSLNDIPIMEKADHPVAVTPDPALRKYAALKGWRIMDL
ncbi:MAG: HAD-IB family hydrolase [Chloroflexi bacterium]|jgi:HAD superfamily hydrolase (TIGR01490 family)|nr:HAD-IB family hydrolase [Chloroflexota bacterium]BCY16845.1 phosphoserine phosphatase [Leptolinea sp. HRD-7]